MGVYELSGAGSLKTGRTLYTSMNAGNQYGAMVPIASAVGNGTSTSAIVFSNIPQIYQDLYLVIYSLQSGAGSLIIDNFNLDGNANSNRSYTKLQGDGTSATSARVANAATISLTPGYSTGSSTIPTTAAIHILNYANTSAYKTILSRVAADANGSGTTFLNVGMWASTSALTAFQISTGSANYFTVNALITLYGIRAVSS